MSLLGKYNTFVDEMMHGAFSAVVAVVAYKMGLDMQSVVIVFLCGWFIDLDHFLNTPLAKKVYKVKDYKGTIKHGDQGYTFKILHGIDLAMIFGLLAAHFSNNYLLGLDLFFTLSFHELWDFIVYPHRWTELLFITRFRSRFNPGLRKKRVGLMFHDHTLKY